MAHHMGMTPCATSEPVTTSSRLTGNGTPMDAIVTTANSAGEPNCASPARIRHGMRVARVGQGALQVPHHILDGPVLLARNRSQRPPVMLLRFDPDGVEQYGGRHVVRVRDERHAH